jgi:endonuclease/exonuclease/phosphatase family metal-dependent hydrolase
MPSYNDLRPDSDDDRQDFALVFPQMPEAERIRAIDKLLALRQALDQQIAAKRADKNLLIGSWNIKEFGHTTQRLPEAYFYMAEIISRLDLVCVQEIKSGVQDLEILMKLLGDGWAYLINDITEGTAGNSERSGYLYDRSRVEFAGLAGEIVLWDEITAGQPITQLKRTPYITGFRAGWKTFAMINVHLHPGDDDDDFDLRAAEVGLLLQAIARKREQSGLWNDNLILGGDFNFYAPTHANDKDGRTIQAIGDAGFRELECLQGVDTNASKTEAYDRLFVAANDYFTIGTEQDREVGGVFDPFDHVYTEAEHATYTPYMRDDYTGSKNLDLDDGWARYFLHPWRKNQLSDHFPIWFELIIDSADPFLRRTLASFE